MELGIFWEFPPPGQDLIPNSQPGALRREPAEETTTTTNTGSRKGEGKTGKIPNPGVTFSFLPPSGRAWNPAGNSGGEPGFAKLGLKAGPARPCGAQSPEAPGTAGTLGTWGKLWELYPGHGREGALARGHPRGLGI